MFAFLLKFGKKEHLEALQKGELYFNSRDFFKGSDDIGRLASDEGYTHIFQSPKMEYVKIYANNQEFDITKDFKTLKLYIPDKDEDKFTHIACFSLVKIDVLEDGIYELISEDMRKMGDYVLWITNIEQFINRLEISAREHPYTSKLTAKPVDYISENYHGDVDIFKKFDRFKYQQEWRCAVRNLKELKRPFILNIGSIEDISTLVPVEKLVFKYKLGTSDSIHVHILTNKEETVGKLV